MIIRLFLCLCLSSLSHLCYAQGGSRYQVDILIFTHPTASLAHLATDNSVPVSLNTNNAITLQTGGDSYSAYHILPSGASQLGSEYRTLSRNSDYQILAYYSWIQPSNNQRYVALPAQNRNGWNLEGTMRVRQSNYYLVDTDLVFTALSNRPVTFHFIQKQRLKPATVYYLDNPYAGLLIKVHKI